MTQEWICKRCFHITSTKSNLLSHLRNAKPCNVDVEKGGENIAMTLYIEQLLEPKKPRKFSCPHCDARFSYTQSRNKHIKNCKYNLDTNKKDEKDKLIEELQAKIESYKQQLQGQSSNATYNQNNSATININNTYNIVTINRNNFGSEDTSYISKDFIKYCIENPSRGIAELIENIHYNPAHPENHNIRCKSLKGNTFEKLVDSEWTLCDASNTLDELIKKGYRILNTYYMDNIHNDTTIQDDEVQQRRYQLFRFLSDKCSNQYYAIKRDLRLLVKTRTDTLYVLALPDHHSSLDAIDD